MLVTFVVFAYNQEEFIEKSLAGALGQTYEPLEIVISDDCSSDKTYEKICAVVAAYEGPHKVIVNRCEKNLGFVQHINEVMSIATGDLIVSSAGDDYSFPNRTERIVEAWCSSKNEVMLVHSAVEKISRSGKKGVRFRSPDSVIFGSAIIGLGVKGDYILGASIAWSRAVFDEYGKLGSSISVEDRIIPFRAAILGEIIYVDEVLLYWREGGLSTSVAEQGYRYDLLHGRLHKIRKWQLENDRYILTEFKDRDYPHKKDVEKACLNRIEVLQFLVDLESMSSFRRLRSLVKSLWITIKLRDLRPIRFWSAYTKDSFSRRLNRL